MMMRGTRIIYQMVRRIRSRRVMRMTRTPITWKGREAKSRRRGANCTICGATNLQRLDIHLARKHKVKSGKEMRETTKKIRAKKTSKTELHGDDIFDRFTRHLRNKGRVEKTAKEYSRIMRKTIKNHEDMVEFFEGRDKFERYCEMAKEEHLPGTARKYISCVFKFAKWCVQDSQALQDTGVRKKSMKRIRNLAQMYCEGLQPAILAHQADCRDAIDDVILTAEEIQETDAALLKPALQIIEKLQIGEHVATKDIYLFRDFLIVRILFSNAQRAGVISNVTMADYRKGKSEVIQDNHVMRVKYHKTRHKFGDVNLVCDAALWRWLSIYVAQGRPCTPGYSSSLDTDESPLFLSAVGGKITKVGQTLTRRGESLGMADPRKILPTNIRKSVVTMTDAVYTRMMKNKPLEIDQKQLYDKARHLKLNKKNPIN